VTDVVEAATGVSLTIDGRSVEAKKGELIIAAAERAGIFIPRFCYHPRMKSVGMCRMCLVEVSGPRGPSLQPACYVEVADGQEVLTASPAARKAQEGVIEYLLLNHPLDCPVCDKGGECPLQDQSVSYGPGESRFDEEKRHWAKPIEIGPLVLLDRERCIQCARCTRFAEEIAGEAFIDFAERGDLIEVAIFPGDPFASYFAGNTVQICPVGALTSTPYRFRSRPWDLEQVETTCTTCAVGCRIVAQSSAGALVRHLGVDSEPVNQSWLCDRGRYGYEAVGGAERLGQPLVRRDEDLVPATWHEALSAVSDAIGRAVDGSGAGAVGFIGGARLANEDAYAWVRLAKGVIGTDNFDAQLGDGLPAELVASLPRATIAETLAASTVVVLAGDLREELPVLHLRLRQAAANDGLRIIDCSPAASGLRAVASWRPYKPGEVVELARSLIASESGEGTVVILGRPSLAESAEQVAAAGALLAEAWPQARFLPALRRGNVHGAIDLGCAPGLLPGRVGLAEAGAWYAEHWGAVPARRGLDTAAMLEAAASGELTTLVLVGADPLSDFPDRELAKRALEHVEFLVSVDTVLNASSMLADVVFAAAGYAERAGTTTNIEGRVSRLAAKVVPPGVARADWVIATELSERLGKDLGFESLESIWAEIERVAPAYSGCTAAALASPAAADGIVVPLRAAPVGLSTRPQKLDPIATPGIESVEEQGAPLAAGAALSPGVEPAPDEELDYEELDDEELDGQELDGQELDGTASGGNDRSDEAAPNDEAGSGGARRAAATPGLLRFQSGDWTSPAPVPPPAKTSWRLVARRGLYDHGTLVQSARSLAPLAPPQVLRLAPVALDPLGVSPGDTVTMSTPRGSLRTAVAADSGVPEGVALLQFNAAPVYEAGAASLIDHGLAVVEVELKKVD
jgi:NADH-quinone oxidoreductase subunit G